MMIYHICIYAYMPVCIYAVIINDIFIYHADMGNWEGSWEKESESGLDKRVRWELREREQGNSGHQIHLKIQIPIGPWFMGDIKRKHIMMHLLMSNSMMHPTMSNIERSKRRLWKVLCTACRGLNLIYPTQHILNSETSKLCAFLNSKFGQW